MDAVVLLLCIRSVDGVSKVMLLQVDLERRGYKYQISLYKVQDGILRVQVQHDPSASVWRGEFSSKSRPTTCFDLSKAFVYVCNE